MKTLFPAVPLLAMNQLLKNGAPSCKARNTGK
jgi:hypothetical protein